MRLFVFPVEYALEAHSSCKVIKVLQELASNLIIICHGCWNEFKSFRHEVYLVACKFYIGEFFNMFFVGLKSLVFCSSRLNFLRSLRFLFAAFGLFVTLFPSLVLGVSDNRQVYCFMSLLKDS